MPKIVFLDPRRELSNKGRGFRFGAIPGTDIFGDTRPPNIDQNPHLYSGFSQRGAGCHASLWIDQISDFRLYMVIAVGDVLFVPNSNFPVFQEVQVRPIILPYAIVCKACSHFGNSTDLHCFLLFFCKRGAQAMLCGCSC